MLYTERPTCFTRRAASELQISRRLLQNILNTLQLHPYRPSLVQALDEDDYDRRLQFCEVFLNQLREDENLVNKIIWTDESSFKLNGIVNRHNCVYWATNNPHVKMEQVLNLPGITVFAGILSAGILGPFFFNGTVTENEYLRMLNEMVWPIVNHRADINEVIWMQNGAPLHYDVRVQLWLDEHFLGRWIGRRGPIERPARFPDLTPSDFFL